MEANGCMHVFKMMKRGPKPLKRSMDMFGKVKLSHKYIKFMDYST